MCFSGRSSGAVPTRATESRWRSWPVCRSLCWSRARELVEELSEADISVRARQIAEAEPAVPKKKPVPKLDEVDLNQNEPF